MRGDRAAAMAHSQRPHESSRADQYTHNGHRLSKRYKSHANVACGPKTIERVPVIAAEKLWYCTKKGEPSDKSGYQWSKGETPCRRSFIASVVICRCMPLSLG